MMNATFRFRTAIAMGYTREEAEQAKNDPSFVFVDKINEKKTKNLVKRSFRFTLIRNLETNESIICTRGWCMMADFDGFELDAFNYTTSFVVLDWKYLHNEGKELPMEFDYNNRHYIILGASQGGLKNGTCVAFEENFVKKNEEILRPEWAKELTTQKQCQRISLMLSCAEKTEALIKNIIILPAFSREDKFVDGEGLFVKHTGNEEHPYTVETVEEYTNALCDGFAIAGKTAGFGKRKYAIIRPTKGLCAIVDFDKYGINHTSVIDYFGVRRIVTNNSIIVTTDNVKDIKAFKKNGGYLEEERWQKAQASEYVYVCNTFNHEGKIELARQMTDKFTQIEDVTKFVDISAANLALYATERGYAEKLADTYRVLKLSQLENMLKSPALYDATMDKVVGMYHDICGGRIAVKGSVCYGIGDLKWFTDVYVWNNGNNNIIDYSRTAGEIPAGCVKYGKNLVDMTNLDENGLPLDKNGNPVYIVLGRFPQINPKMMRMRVVGDAEVKGCISFSMQDMEDALINLDADLDGDEFMCIEDEQIIEAVRVAQERFNFKTIVYETMTENPEAKHCSLQQYMKWALEWSQVGLAVYPIFEQMELVPLLKDGEDWRTIKVPVFTRDNGWKRRYLQKVIEHDIPIVSCQGHDATDGAKRGNKGGIDSSIMEWYSPAPMSHWDAKRTQLSEMRARLDDVANANGVRVNEGIIARIRADIRRRGLKLETRYLENCGVKEYPTFVKRPEGNFEGVEASVWRKSLRSDLMGHKLVLKKSEVSEGFYNKFLQGAAGSNDAAENAEAVIDIMSAFRVASELQKISVKEDEHDTMKEVCVDITTSIIEFMNEFCKQNNIYATDAEKVWMAYNKLAETFFSAKCAENGWLVGQFLVKFSKCIEHAVRENSGESISARAHVETGESSQGIVSAPSVIEKEPVVTVSANAEYINEIPVAVEINTMPSASAEEMAQIMAARKSRGGFGKKTAKAETSESIIAAMMANINFDDIPEE